MIDELEDGLPANRTPEIAYLNNLAEALINARKIKSMVFYLDTGDADPSAEPTVMFFGDFDLQDCGFAITRELNRMAMIKRRGAEEGVHTTPVNQVVTLPCDMEGCIKESGHFGNHQNSEGVGWHSGEMPKGRA